MMSRPALEIRTAERVAFSYDLSRAIIQDDYTHELVDARTYLN